MQLGGALRPDKCAGESALTRDELASLCLAFPGAYEDDPFHDPNWTVIRHQANQKIFAMIYERGGRLCVNLKCEPMHAQLLRSVYEGVAPGFHMNKAHWNTVWPDADVPPDELHAMIRESYARTRPKACGKKHQKEGPL